MTGVCCLDGGRGNTYQVGEQMVQEDVGIHTRWENRWFRRTWEYIPGGRTGDRCVLSRWRTWEYIPGGRTDGSGGGVTGVCCLDGGRGTC